MDRKSIEVQIAGCEAAIKNMQDGIEVNKVVLKAFQEELKKCPKKK